MSPGQWLQRHRWTVLAVCGALTALSLVALPYIRFDFTPQAVFSGQQDVLDRAEQFREDFGYDDATILIVLDATGPADTLQPEALDWQRKVTGALARLDDVQDARSVATLEVPRLVQVFPPKLEPRPLLADGPVNVAEAGKVRHFVDRSSLVTHTLISADRKTAAIVVTLPADTRTASRSEAIQAQIQTVLDASPPPEGYRTIVAGLPVFRSEIVNALRSDLLTMLPAAGGLFLVVLAVVFRRISGTLVPLAAVGIGLAWTVGLLVALDQEFNILTNVLPVLLFVIGVSNCVHVVSRYAEESARTPGDRVGSARRVIDHMALACLLTYATTAVGFSSLMTARSAILCELGWQAVVGMVFLYVTTIAICGALLDRFAPPKVPHPERSRPDWIGRAIGWVGHEVSRHPLPTILGASGIVIGAVLAAQQVTIDSYLFETYPPDHPSMRDLYRIENQLAGVIPLEISIEADSPDALLTPDAFRRVEKLRMYASVHDEVLYARSYVDLHQEVHAQLAGQPEYFHHLPAETPGGRARIAQTHSLLRRFDAVTDYHRFLRPDDRRGRIMLRVRDVGSRQTLRLMDDLQATADRLFPPGEGIRVTLTGDAHLHARTMDYFVRDMVYALIGASVVIFVIIGLLFRSVRLGLVAVLPNLTPLVITWGYMGLRGYVMNASNVIVFTISIGIAVDATIHFLARFREEIDRDGDVHKAIRRSFHGAGRAIVLATALIVAGLSVLGASNFMPSRRFAELTSVTMVGALVGDMLLLPACLVLLWPGRARPSRLAEPVGKPQPVRTEAKA